MADRTSAALFARIFQLLAKNPTDEHKAIALEIYGFLGEYDFSPYQMYCDEALVILGLAKIGFDPSEPEDGEFIVFLGDPEFDAIAQAQNPA